MPEAYVVAAGSLLGVAINSDGYSAPVGKVDTLTLYPMTFDEFLYAAGQREFDAGAITENYVAQTLSASGFNLFYWTSQGKAELDFVIDLGSEKAIPLEVKSSDNVRSKSLSVYCDKYKPPYALRISTKNFGFENGIRSIPLYAAFCIKASMQNKKNCSGMPKVEMSHHQNSDFVNKDE